MLNKIKSLYSYCGRYLGAMRYAPTKKQMQICLFVFGVFMLTAGLQMDVMAQVIQELLTLLVHYYQQLEDLLVL